MKIGLYEKAGLIGFNTGEHIDAAKNQIVDVPESTAILMISVMAAYVEVEHILACLLHEEKWANMAEANETRKQS